METTLTAMKRVTEVKQKRQDLFYRMRMRAFTGMQRDEIRAEIKKGIELLAPAAANKEIAIANATKNLVKQRETRKRVAEDRMEN